MSEKNKKCNICEKEFFPNSEHMYKRSINKQTEYQCSYTCYRKSGGDNGIYGKSQKIKSLSYV